MIDFSNGARLKPPEIVAFYVCVAVLALFCCLAVVWQQPVAWGEVVFRSVAALGVGTLGLFYRVLNRNEGIALAFIGTGLFVGFTNSAVLVSYLFLPVSRPVVDPLLINVDGLLGYHWQSFVVALADYPVLGRALGWVYLTSIVQMFGLILFLAFSHRHIQLYRFIAVGMLAGLVTIAIWAVFPSFGPTAYQQVPVQTAQKIGLVVTSAYGQELLRLADEGSAVLSISNVLGVIAFPSFHTVMAAIAVWFSRGLIFFFPILAINLMMIPAILSHGGHHLVDVFGGVIVFAIAVLITHKLLPDVAQSKTQASDSH